MYSGTVFVRQREPNPSLQLPRSCWDVYDRLDGDASIGEIATDLGLSEAEMFAVVRQLQQWDLIEEPVLSYPAYQGRESDARAAEETDEAGEPAISEVRGDGVRSAAMNGKASTDAESVDEESGTEALHLPTLWDWLKDTTDNVKSYKNTQAFVLMEASDALESIGVANMDELEDLEQCQDADVIRALEAAVENNVNESIPARCYR